MKQTILIFFIYPLLVWGQNAATDFKKINTFYLSDNFYCKVNCKIYESWEGATLIDEKEGEVKKSGSRKYYSMGDMESFTTSVSYLAVDKTSRSIFLSKLKLNGNNDADELIASIDVMLKLCKKISYKDESPNSASYTLMYPSRDFGKVKIIFNKEKFYIQQLIIYSKIQDNKDVYKGKLNNPRVEISFSKVVVNKKYKEQDFSFDKYIELKNGKWAKKKEYSSYYFLDQLTANNQR
jgi:hypothetical protein